jgi:hypothetical protein
MTNAQSSFDQLGSELAERTPATIGRMFGMPCLKVGGKAFAGLSGEAMVFKLTGPAHAQALALEGARLFDPMGGRPMKEWVEVPEAQAKRWPELAEAALAYVGGGRRPAG